MRCCHVGDSEGESLTKDGDVLVIAPDGQLRRSIAFLLEAEGYRISSHATVPMQAGYPAAGRCAVIDEDALTDGEGLWPRLQRLASSFVMLSSGLLVPRPHFLMHSVEKPLLGQSLVEAVEAAIRGIGDGSR